MGFDDYITSGFIRPALTTMQMPAAEMGRRALDILIAQRTGRQSSESAWLYASLVERTSTGQAPAG